MELTENVSRLDMGKGLSSIQIPLLQKQFGKNIYQSRSSSYFLHVLKDVFIEPMFILLLVACSLYFILGKLGEGMMMAVAIGIVAAISIYEGIRSSLALRALKELTAPLVTVIRNGVEQVIGTEELVPGDLVLLAEGMKIPADAILLQGNDCSIDESVITGESLPVEKYNTEGANVLYQGSTMTSGKCLALVTATGVQTILGKTGKAIETYTPAKTVLQAQVNKLVKRLALFGLIGFLAIFLVNYLKYDQFTSSLLFALTLAMAVIPEEIPVAFSSFMALGAHKMSRFGVISRQPQVIENLGAVTVLCLDKTGTITENRMEVRSIYDYKTNSLIDTRQDNSLQQSVLYFAMLASEADPFDPMEKAILEAYRSLGNASAIIPGMIHEYPLEGRPPMMTHGYYADKDIIVAGKGGPERILEVCKLGDPERGMILNRIRDLASKGYRVLGIASAVHNAIDWPEKQDDFNWQFEGLLALYDPPKENSAAVLKKINEAKIGVKMITGDYPETAIHIATEVGILNPTRFCTGNDILNMNPEVLQATVKNTQVYCRMFPEAKLKVINALKANGEIVAMTGDGVNDGPALKAADIGIAMGKKGTEIARQASDLVLTDDNLEKIHIAVMEGRRIYANLIKAIRYIIAIHIPIILTASLPVILGWKFPNIFSPIHIIFLELIMGPTCSIFFEKEPVEEASILAGPRDYRAGLFTADELLMSIVQGFVITAGVMILYFIFIKEGRSEEETRNIVFTTLIISNVFLTFSTRSFTKTMYYTSRFKNNLALVILLAPAAFLVLLHFVPALQLLFQLSPIRELDFWICFAVAFACTMWFEAYKMDLRKET